MQLVSAFTRPVLSVGRIISQAPVPEVPVSPLTLPQHAVKHKLSTLNYYCLKELSGQEAPTSACFTFHQC